MIIQLSAKFATAQKNIDRNSKTIRKHIDNALKKIR